MPSPLPPQTAAAAPPAPPAPQSPPAPPATLGFAQGLRAPIAALRHLRAHPGHWRHALVAAALHIASFVATAALLVPRATPWLSAVWAAPDGGAALLGWRAVWLVLSGVLLVASYICSALLAQVLLAPLNDRLSDQVERAVLGGVGAPFVMRQFVGDVAQGIAHSLLNLVALAVATLAALALNLVPLVGPVAATAAGLLISSSFAAVEFTDWPMARRRMTWRAKWAVARAHAPAYLGLGLGLQLLLAVPVLNLLLLPVAVTAGTLLYCDLAKRGDVPA